MIDLRGVYQRYVAATLCVIPAKAKHVYVVALMQSMVLYISFVAYQ